MNPKFKKLWLNGLRSDKYKQARSTLNNGNGGFCCLGVLCDVVSKTKAGKEMGLAWSKKNISQMTATKYDEQGGYLPTFVRDLVGLTTINPVVKVKGGKIGLAALNDARCLSFKQIARYIENQL